MPETWVTLRCSVCGAAFLHAASSPVRPKTCGMLACMVRAGEAKPVEWEWADGSD